MFNSFNNQQRYRMVGSGRTLGYSNGIGGVSRLKNDSASGAGTSGYIPPFDFKQIPSPTSRKF